MHNALSAPLFPSSQPLPSGQPLSAPAGLNPVTAAEQTELFALLHTLLETIGDLQLRLGQLEHAEHLRAALRPRRDLGIDY